VGEVVKDIAVGAVELVIVTVFVNTQLLGSLTPIV
jgi:hypothetical protein